MPDQLSQSRDRITELLTSRRPSRSDAATAMLRAVTGGASYGETLNKMKATQLAEAKTLYDVLAGYKGLEQTDRQLGMQEQKNNWQQIKDARERGIGDAEATAAAIERYAKSEQDRAVLADKIHALPEEITALNADAAVSRAANELYGSKRIGGLDPKSVTFTYGNFIPSGTSEAVAARKSNLGSIEIQDDSGKWKRAPKGSFVSQSVQASSIGDLGTTKKEMVSLREQRDSMTNLIKSANRLRDDIKVQGANAIGWAGAIERFADTTVAQGRALANRWGDGTMIQELANSFDWSPALAAQSAAVKSQISSMAYTIALMKNGTRPTDEDVRHALTMMGTSGSPEQMLAAIDSLMRESVDSYATRHQTLTGKKWDAPQHFQEYGLPIPGEGKQLEYISDLSDQELGSIEITPENASAVRKEIERRRGMTQ